MTSQPKTLNDAVAWALRELSPEQKGELCELNEQELALTHRGLGGWVRQELGLWGKNSELMRAIGVRHPDDASAKLVRAIWEALRDDGNK